jgi:hypothetical protein
VGDERNGKNLQTLATYAIVPEDEANEAITNISKPGANDE